MYPYYYPKVFHVYLIFLSLLAVSCITLVYTHLDITSRLLRKHLLDTCCMADLFRFG